MPTVKERLENVNDQINYANPYESRLYRAILETFKLTMREKVVLWREVCTKGGSTVMNATKLEMIGQADYKALEKLHDRGLFVYASGNDEDKKWGYRYILSLNPDHAFTTPYFNSLHLSVCDGCDHCEKGLSYGLPAA